MDIRIYLEYNAVVTLTYFFVCFVVLALNYLTGGKSNEWFTCKRRSIWSLKTYICLITHAFGHADWDHLAKNFLMILLLVLSHSMSVRISLLIMNLKVCLNKRWERLLFLLK